MLGYFVFEKEDIGSCFLCRYLERDSDGSRVILRDFAQPPVLVDSGRNRD